MSRPKDSSAPPRGLAVERFEAFGEEFAAFTWPTGEQPQAQLAPGERAVLAAIVAGRSNADIARLRGTSVRTIANQVASILRKTGATSRFDLVRRFAGNR